MISQNSILKSITKVENTVRIRIYRDRMWLQPKQETCERRRKKIYRKDNQKKKRKLFILYVSGQTEINRECYKTRESFFFFLLFFLVWFSVRLLALILIEIFIIVLYFLFKIILVSGFCVCRNIWKRCTQVGGTGKRPQVGTVETCCNGKRGRFLAIPHNFS